MANLPFLCSMFKNCYHLCTTALRNAVLCRDREDYIFLWNSIALLATMSGIKVYCLCLMTNHFHLLLGKDPELLDLFFNRLKIRLGRYLMRKYKKTPVQGLEYRLFSVADRRAFCQEIAYILRNPYKAKLGNPFSYPWSSALAYFLPLERTGRPAAEMSVRDRMLVLNTKQPIPGTLLVSPGGMILPESFVDVAFCEQMFGNSPCQFFDLLRKWNLEDIVDGAHGETITDAYSDEEVLRGIREICRDDFGGEFPERMDQRARVRLVKRVTSRFGASRAQLLRLLPVDDYLLDRIL